MRYKGFEKTRPNWVRLSYKYLRGVYHGWRQELGINEVAAYKRVY